MIVTHPSGRRIQLKRTRLTLGDEFLRGNQTMRFIKVTNKGFNVLNVGRNRCIFKRPLYAKGYGNKPLPPSKRTFEFFVPDWLADAKVVS